MSISKVLQFYKIRKIKSSLIPKIEAHRLKRTLIASIKRIRNFLMMNGRRLIRYSLKIQRKIRNRESKCSNNKKN